MKKILLAGLITFCCPFLLTSEANAACSNPAGSEGDMMYNSTHNVMQFCDGTDWTGMKSTLKGLSCSDGQVAKWNNAGSAWVCANDADTDTGITVETDPEVNTLTAGQWCTSDGSVINCTTAAPVTTETDPEVGTLTTGKWCITDGSVINCTVDPVTDTDTDTLASLSCSDGEIAKWNNTGSAWECAADSTADNLGDHTATTDIDAASNDINNINMLEFDSVAGDAPVSASGSLNGLSCTSGQVPKWNGSIWVCADDTLGTHTATEALDMATFDITNGGDFTATAYFHSSDRRLKDNIQASEGLDLIMQMRGVTYDWKSNGAASAGVIAQEVESVFPRAVITDGKGMKAVEYDQLIAPLIEAVKDLKAQNDALQKRIEELESRE